MGENIKLSIVIPCWNCEETIGRLLDSIIQNGWDKADYEVVICDDKSTDGFLEVVKMYEDRINFVYCETTRDFHCPGNTRQAALSHIHGEWFTFIDNDDMFEPNAFDQVFSYINEHDNIYTICTNFREYYYEEKKYGRIIENGTTDTWLHGKFFNKKKTLDEFNCHFENDLFSHEDVYFNSCNLAHLISIGEDYIYLPIFTYKWVYNPKSLSRSYFEKDFYYIETYLGDYLHGASYPYFDMYINAENEKNKSFAWNQIEMTLLHGYFYYEASVWRLGSYNTYEDSYMALRRFKKKMITELKVNEFDIINYIYQNPERYNSIKKRCEPGSCAFVETQSFRDFILNL